MIISFVFIHSPYSDQILIIAKLQLLSQRLSNVSVVLGGEEGGGKGRQCEDG